MKFDIKKVDSGFTKQSCLILAVSGDKLSKNLPESFSGAEKKQAQQFLKKHPLEEKIGSCKIYHLMESTFLNHIVFIQCGTKKSNSGDEFIKLIENTSKLIRGLNKRAFIFLDQYAVDGGEPKWLAQQLVVTVAQTAYKFDEYKSKTKKQTLEQVTILANQDTYKQATAGLKTGKAIASGCYLMRDLANTPANICTPTYLANKAKAMAKNCSTLKVNILGEDKMKSLKMGALLSVSQGSPEPAKLISFEYNGGKKNQKPLVFVGKGVTFDTGGNSLKPPVAMIGMKYDMSGAACVFGLMDFVSQLKLPINIVGLVGATENTPGGKATRPEDIVSSMSGKTVEILNTDAEGRLVLCDLLTYCKKFKPEAVIDMATLTGAVIMALGHVSSAVMSNNQSLANEILSAGKHSRDKVWQLPLWDEYQSDIDSNIADIKNIGNGPSAGTITGGCFLSRFTKDYDWAHLDIAGTASKTVAANQYTSTGRPLPLLSQFILNKVAKNK